MVEYLYVNLDLFSVFATLKQNSCYVLYVLIMLVMNSSDSSRQVRLNKAIADDFLKGHLDEEKLRKFSSPRFSEGIRELIEKGVIERVPNKKYLYTYNKNLFKFPKNR